MKKITSIRKWWVAGAVATVLIIAFSCAQMKQANANPSFKPSKVYKSNYDFMPYDGVVWTESFATTPVGDFPKGWATNASAEVVSDKEKSGKALLLTKDGLYMPMGVSSLPQEFTLEFNLACSSNYSYYSSPFDIQFASLNSKKEYTVLKQYNPHTKDAVKIWLHPNNAASYAGYSGYEQYEKGSKQNTNEVNTSQFFSHGGPASVKVSIWRQHERLRVYLNEEKTWDLPQGFDEAGKYNTLVFGIHHLVDHSGKYFLSDFRMTAPSLATKTSNK